MDADKKAEILQTIADDDTWLASNGITDLIKTNFLSKDNTPEALDYVTKTIGT
jgi:hypothetical protein